MQHYRQGDDNQQFTDRFASHKSCEIYYDSSDTHGNKSKREPVLACRETIQLVGYRIDTQQGNDHYYYKFDDIINTI